MGYSFYPTVNVNNQHLTANTICTVVDPHEEQHKCFRPYLTIASRIYIYFYKNIMLYVIVYYNYFRLFYLHKHKYFLSLTAPSTSTSSYRSRLGVVPTVSGGGSKLCPLRSVRRGELLFVHGHVDLRNHVHWGVLPAFQSLPWVSLNIKSKASPLSHSCWLLPFSFTLISRVIPLTVFCRTQKTAKTRRPCA